MSKCIKWFTSFILYLDKYACVQKFPYSLPSCSAAQPFLAYTLPYTVKTVCFCQCSWPDKFAENLECHLHFCNAYFQFFTELMSRESYGENKASVGKTKGKPVSSSWSAVTLVMCIQWQRWCGVKGKRCEAASGYSLKSYLEAKNWPTRF